MMFGEAWPVAVRLMEELAPFVTRAEIAGSIRRNRDQVGDIEIVAIPAPDPAGGDLFGVATVHPGFVAAVERYTAVKGSPTGRYTQRILPDGINLDLFIARPENWGLILAIRTGSAEYCRRVLAPAWVHSGFRSVDGMLVRNGRQVPVYEEGQLFRLCGLPWVRPEDRL